MTPPFTLSALLAARPGQPPRAGLRLPTLLTVLPLLAFAAYAVLEAVGAYRTAEEARLRGTAQALAAAVDEQIGGVVAALQGIAAAPYLTEPLDTAMIEARGRAFGEPFGGWIVVFGAGGPRPPLAISLRDPERPVPAQRPAHVAEAQDRALAAVLRDAAPAVSDVFDAPVRGRPVFLTFVPVMRDGSVTHALAMGREAMALQALLLGQHLPGGTFAAITDSRGHVVADTRLAARGDGVPEGLGRPAPAWLAQLADPGARGMARAADQDGREVAIVTEALGQAPGWTVLVGQPVAAQTAGAWNAMRMVLIGALALAFGLAFAAWTSRRDALRAALRETAALRAGRAEVERLHASMPVLIFLREVEPDGATRLIYRGGDVEHVTGWPAGELARHDNLMRAFGVSSDETRAFLRRVMDEGSATIEWQFRQPDGSCRQVLQSGRRLTRRPDGGGEMVGYLVDVTAARAAEAKALAAGRLAALGEMSASLVHELRQPLQAITLAAETAEAMAAELGAPDLERRLVRLVEQAERAGRVMEQLRRFARGDETTAAAQPVCLAQVVENTLLMTGGALREASVTVETALGDPAPVVAGQPLALEQVLTNLLLNARDAMAAGTPKGERRLRISASPAEDGMVRIEVADTGGGIAPEVMGRLFEPFVSTKPAEAGTGLGLAICHGLVLGMGGTLQARNEDRGAVFTICLPAWAPAVADPEPVPAG